MDLAGVQAAKKTITSYIEKDMGQNDQAAVTSASGQIGFLQQLTNDRMVLRTALDRLKPKTFYVKDPIRPQMNEYQAMLIDRRDPDVLGIFIDQTIQQNPGMTRDSAEAMVQARAASLLAYTASLTKNSLLGLKSLVKTARNLPGRKVVFLLSGGFQVHNQRGDLTGELRDITYDAAKSGVVIYSMDTRGLVASLTDASSDGLFDPTGRLDRASHGELYESQNGMNALAVDTGGKAIFNTNDLRTGLAPALQETSNYYLIAWKPDTESQKQTRFRNVEVKLIGLKDYTVRVRKGYFDVDPPQPVVAKKKDEPPRPQSAPAKIREALKATYPERALPILMSADYYDVAGKGPVVNTSVQVPGEFLVFGEQPDGKIQAVLDLSGLFLDDKGAVKASFLERIVTTAPDLESTKGFKNDILFTYPAKLTPGLYQVRVAARDDKGDKAGSANMWIEVPDLTKKKLAMSSLLLGERMQGVMTNVSDQPGANPVSLSASHHFKRESTLRFLIFAYNAVPSSTDQKPDVAVQVHVIRDDQPVLTTALRKVSVDGVTDLERLPYAAEIPLAELTPGRYVLRVTLIDRVSKESTSRQTHFDVY
jgi:VWFA-related protein